MAETNGWTVDQILSELHEHEKDAGAQMIKNVLDEPIKVAEEEVATEEVATEKTAEELELQKEAELWTDRGTIFADAMWNRLNEKAVDTVEKVAADVTNSTSSEKVAAAMTNLTKKYLGE